MRTRIALPGEPVPEGYFETRFNVLRDPLGAPRGSERIDGDSDAIHVWLETDEKVISVGRAALIPDGEDGSAVDVKANSACPPFHPLSCDHEPMVDDNGVKIPHDLRPAIQIRQMGTLTAHRGKGWAGTVLKELEQKSMDVWDAHTGWLQARTEALPFYKRGGWTCFGAAYSVPNVGPHRSMWKKFR